MDYAWGVAVSPDGSYVFVAGAGSDSVAVVDVTTKTAPVVRSGVVSATYMASARRVAVSPDGNYVFVTGYGSDSVAVVDVTTKATPVVRGGVVSATFMDYAWGVAVSADGNSVFVTGANTDSVAVVDVTNKTGYTTHIFSTGTTQIFYPLTLSTTRPVCAA
jgi:DNA-binding beta-propeller fold protein YncE